MNENNNNNFFQNFVPMDLNTLKISPITSRSSSHSTSSEEYRKQYNKILNEQQMPDRNIQQIERQLHNLAEQRRKHIVAVKNKQKKELQLSEESLEQFHDKEDELIVNREREVEKLKYE